MRVACVIIAALLSAITSGYAAAPKTPKPADVQVSVRGMQIQTQGVSKTASNDVRVVIEQQTALTEDTEMTGPLADDLAFFVRQRYLDLGYADATVDWDIVGNAAELRVVEGTRYEVGAITFEGSTSVPKTELTRYLLRRTHEKLGETSNHPPFVEADLKDGAGLVQRLLMANGYLDAVVAEPVFTSRESAGAQDVLVKIKEGQRYVFGDIQVTGALLGREAEIEELVSELRDQPFNEVKMEDVRTRIVGIYEKRGHFTAVATAAARGGRPKDGRIGVAYTVEPGSQFRIAGIELAPDMSNGAQRIARSGFKRSVGDVYSPADLDVMHRQVLDSEIFARLDVTPRPIGDDTMVLEISGDEAKTRRYSAYAGYETFRGPVIGVESRKVNWNDTGNALRLKAEANGVGFGGGVTLIDPAVFNSAYSLETELGAETEAVFDYERQTYLARALLKRQWNRNISSRVFADASMNDAESDVLTPFELGPAEYQTASVGASIAFDYRDSPLVPADGWYTSVTVTGMFGDVSYLRSDLVVSVYQPLTKRLRVALGGKATLVQTQGDVFDIPIDLRVFNGGATSVRSFPEREMGQKALRSDTPLGGLASEVVSLELSYEISPNLELALFGDAGTLRPSDDFAGLKFDELRYAIGLGIRYKLPIGPLRVDYGWNPDREEGEPFGALHITFGFAF
jgi:outer membrane protein insertion porin family